MNTEAIATVLREQNWYVNYEDANGQTWLKDSPAQGYSIDVLADRWNAVTDVPDNADATPPGEVISTGTDAASLLAFLSS